MSKRPSRELTKDPVLGRIMDLLVKQGKTEKDMTQHLGIANSTFTVWKYEERKTFLQHIGRIAEYLNVSTNYLLYGYDKDINETTMSVAEIDLLKMFRKMKPEQQDCVLRTSKCFLAINEGTYKT